MTRLQRMKKKSTIQNKSSGDDNVKRRRTGENSRLRRYQRSKKERCEVSKATVYFWDIIIKKLIFFLFQVSPVSGKGSIKTILKVRYKAGVHLCMENRPIGRLDFDRSA